MGAEKEREKNECGEEGGEKGKARKEKRVLRSSNSRDGGKRN